VLPERILAGKQRTPHGKETRAMFIQRISGFGLTLAATGVLMAGVAVSANAQTASTSSPAAQFAPSTSSSPAFPGSQALPVHPGEGSGVVYEIRNGAHGLCLDAASQNAGGNGDKIQLWKCTGASNQLWGADNLSSPPTQIVNQSAGLCLDAASQNINRNGDKIQLWDCTGASNQLWAPLAEQSPPPPALPVGNWASHECLDAMAQHDGSNGDPVQEWTCNNGSNQNWQFVEVSD
jgi:hypothetical protein